MTDKERLEEIKNSHLRGIHSLFGTPWVSMPKDNFEWLIKQAERVEELEEEVDRLNGALHYQLSQENIQNEENRKLKYKNKRYREAIERAIDKLTWNSVESEEILRKALEGEE